MIIPFEAQWANGEGAAFKASKVSFNEKFISMAQPLERAARPRRATLGLNGRRQRQIAARGVGDKGTPAQVLDMSTDGRGITARAKNETLGFFGISRLSGIGTLGFSGGFNLEG